MLVNSEKLILDLGKDIVSKLWSEASGCCAKCGETVPQYAFPVYGESGGLAQAMIVYFRSGNRFLPVEFDPLLAARCKEAFTEFMVNRAAEAENRGTYVNDHGGDMGRASRQDRFDWSYVTSSGKAKEENGKVRNAGRNDSDGRYSG